MRFVVKLPFVANSFTPPPSPGEIQFTSPQIEGSYPVYMKREIRHSFVAMALAIILVPVLGAAPAAAQDKKGPPPPGAAMATPLDGKGKQKAPKPPPGPEIHTTIFIGKPAPDVWKALVTKDIVDQYYMMPLLTLDGKVGGKIAYGMSGVEAITGKVVKWQEPDAAGTADAILVHTFKFDGTTDPETTVSYTVKPIGKDMCALSISHTGYKAENETFAEAAGGWPVILSSLKTLMETGKRLPWPTGPSGGGAPAPSTDVPTSEDKDKPSGK
ncbi:hypothetical protein DB346_17965 [Verrucomicrobia bacterium LW23]|nr:hypothetical protein DB346_17965 [Verrucomicrobia bacterium LW23]